VRKPDLRSHEDPTSENYEPSTLAVVIPTAIRPFRHGRAAVLQMFPNIVPPHPGLRRPAGRRSHQDGATRCFWWHASPKHISDHDSQSSFAVRNDRQLFGKFVFEGFQYGLSWLTILRKRDEFRRGFVSFDIEEIARFTSRHVDRLPQNANIVRSGRKSENTINSVRRCADLVDKPRSFATCG